MLAKSAGNQLHFVEVYLRNGQLSAKGDLAGRVGASLPRRLGFISPAYG